MPKHDDHTPSAGDTTVRPRTQAGLPNRPRGRYQFGDEHARGGLGRVTWARDVELDREVAVKELLEHEPGHDARFVREAMITARLQHPGIVPVYEAGRWSNGEPFYTMKMVSGTPLKDVIANAEDSAARLEAVANVLTVAETIAYAHSERVIHRDLKPSNVIVGSFGETVVIDWGLARVMGQPDVVEEKTTAYRTRVEPSLTRAGAVIGTPAYMSPEQARGEVVDERSDVYALGALLYCVVSGGAPFEGKSSDAILAGVRERAAEPLSDLIKDAPAELVAIVERAMARDPAERYPSASAFAADLRRFQTGLRVTAHNYSTLSLVRRWIGNHRAVVAVATLALLLLVIGGVLSFANLEAERERTVAERDRAREANRALTEERNQLILTQARAVLESDPTRSLAWLKNYDGDDWGQVQEIAADAQGRGVSRHVFPGITSAPWQTYFSNGVDTVFTDSKELLHWRPSDGTYSVITEMDEIDHHSRYQLDPRGRFVVYTLNRRLFHYDLVTRTTTRLGERDGPPVAPRISLADGGRTVITMWGGAVAYWDLETRKVTVVETGTNGIVASRNGDLIAGRISGDKLLVEHRPTGLKTSSKADGPWRLSRDGRRLASVASGSLRLFDLQDGWRTWEPPLPLDTVNFVGPDQLLVTSPRNRRGSCATSFACSKLVSFSSLEIISELHAPNLAAAEADTEGEFLAFSSDEGLQVFEAGGSLRLELPLLPARLQFIDPTLIAAITKNSARHTQVAIQGHRIIHERVPYDARLAVSTASDRIAVRSAFSAVPIAIVDRRSGKIEGQDELSKARQFAWRTDGVLLYGEEDRIRSVPRDALEIITPRLVRFALIPKDETLATIDSEGEILLWKSLGDEPQSVGRHRGDNLGLWPTGDGGLLSASREGRIELWDLATQTSRSIDAGPLNSVSESGGAIAAMGIDGTLHFWKNVDSIARTLSVRPGVGAAVRFSQSGRWLAAGWGSGEVELYDIHEMKLRFRLAGRYGSTSRLAFSIDETLLAIATDHGPIYAIGTDAGSLATLHGHKNTVSDLVFDADGLLLSTGVDGTLREWRIGEAVPGGREALRNWLEATTDARVNESGRFIQTARRLP